MNLEIFDKHKMAKTKRITEKPFTCRYCGNGFTKESTLLVHSCEKKRRHLAKDQKHVQMGFLVYTRFFELTQNAKGTKTYEQFVESAYYNAFVKFGSFLSNVDPLYPSKYIDWIVTSGIKLDHWCNEELYYKYILEFIKKEPAETALTRSIDTMDKWAEKNNSQWDHYFKYVTPARAVYDIRDGKISPWLVLNCKSGKQLLNGFNDEQLSLIYSVMDPDFWTKRFKIYPGDIALVKMVVEQSNL